MIPNFRRQKLRKQNFKGQDLSTSDFDDAEIKGIDFSDAILLDAKLRHAKAGLNPVWDLGLKLSLIVLSILYNFVIGYSGTFMGAWLPRIEFLANKFLALTFGLSLFILFIVVAIRRGLGAALSSFAIIVVLALTVLAALPGDNNTKAGIIFYAVGIAVGISGMVPGAIAVSIAQILSDRKIWAVIMLAVPLASVAGIKAGVVGDIYDAQTIRLAVIGAVPITIALVGLSFYIGTQAILGNLKYGLIRRIAIAISNYGGTSFRVSNLTNADFTQADLRQTDFREANLTRTRWFQAQNLAQARTDDTYLENPKIRQLVVTLNGQDQNFDHMDLRGLNLQGANLADASFIGTKLSEATLEGANLDRAKLVQTQLYGANLSGASLTGAIIQDWSISTDTNFEGVKCDYVYMQLPTKADPDPCRKPDNRNENFQSGDFADFIAPIIKTLNLYQTQNVDLRIVAQQFKTLDLFHHEGIDPTAAAVALKQLAEHHPEADLEVVALEGRGEDKVRLQAKVKGVADRSMLSTEYFATYRKMSAMPYADLQSLLAGMAEKDERIRSLENMVTTAIKSDKFYVETLYSLGDTVTEKSSININAGGDIGSVSGIVGGDMTGVMNLGTISGNVTNSIGQIPDNSVEKAELKSLLKQLQAAIEAEPTLEPEDKAEALSQVQVLAEAGQNPEDGAMKKAAKTAMKILKGTTAGLSETTKFVAECAKLLPAISGLLLLL
ncbi:pentapeptide repeat-containing protein [Nodosilinea sp. AN01ver1]|uniref:pentapeptide repeat-containing protein n=1 Tax=Nodosilinea sp. AN01ver1 TaxID=3423362 RepID=UPI003D3221FA